MKALRILLVDELPTNLDILRSLMGLSRRRTGLPGRVFAIADLHLSLNGDKPMDRFGECWTDHPRRMAQAWDARVMPGDTVLLGGDLSWGRDLGQAAPDLAWIGERPGRKILLRGNHDSWWGSASRVRQALPDGCDILHNNALRAGPWVVLGARGWTAPEDPWAEPGDERIFRRELHRLGLSVAHADHEFGRQEPRLALMHFPPLLEGRPEGDVLRTLREAGVTACAYGHLHGEDHRLAVSGEYEGIRFYFVAVDATDFAPVEIAPPPGQAERRP